MSRIGILSPPLYGHLGSFSAISKRLVANGHTLAFFGLKEAKEISCKLNIEFVSISNDVSLGKWMDNTKKQLSILHGDEALRFWVKENVLMTRYAACFLPKSLIDWEVDFLLIDEMEIVGSSIAQYLNIPFISFSMGNTTLWDDSIPAFHKKNFPTNSSDHKSGQEDLKKMFLPLLKVLNKFRKSWGLSIYEDLNSIFPVSNIAHISQLPSCLDYERIFKPSTFHQVGSLNVDAKNDVDFPFDKLEDKRFVYVSLGTIFNGDHDLIEKIVSIFLKLNNYQLIISLGAIGDFNLIENKYKDTNVVFCKFAPQLKILNLASLCISHGGLNTVLESLNNSVPLIIIPNSLDQPGVASRIEYHRLGRVVARNNVNSELKLAILGVLDDSEIKDNVEEVQKKLVDLKGIEKTMKIINYQLEKHHKNDERKGA